MSKTIGHDNRQRNRDFWSRRPLSMWASTKLNKILCHRIERQEGKSLVRGYIEDLV